MRPVHLTIEGFGAFRDRTEIDFTDTEQFALVGPTGSGKSTVIDAICFVLYGNVPRYDDQRLVGAAMSTGANEMRVRLDFDVAGERYTAVRVVRRNPNGKVSTREARVEHGDDILAGREGDMRPVVEGLLGLSFEDFTRCVVLPQGAFARFLHDRPADRQALLVRLLDLGVYGRILNRANQRAAELDGEMRFLDGGLAELGAAAVDAGDLANLAGRVDVAQARLAASAERIERATTAAAGHADEAGRGAALLGHLEAVAAPAGLGDEARIAAEAAARVQTADRAVTEAGRILEHAEDAVRDTGGVERWELASALHQRIGRGRVVVEERTAAIGDAAEALDRATKAAADSIAEADRAAEALAGAETAHRAHALALELRPGEPCPVCEQVVERLPLVTAPPALGAAAADLTAANGRRDAAVRVRTELEMEHAKAIERLAHARELLDDLVGQADGLDEASVAAGLAGATAAAAALDAARAVSREAGAERRRAQAEADAVTRRSGELAAAYHRQRDRVAELAPPTPTSDIAVSWAELDRWARTEHEALSTRVAQSEASAERARAEVATLLAAAVEGTPVAARVPRDAPSADAALQRAAEEIAADLAAHEARRARRAEMEAKRAAADAERMVAAELGRLLKADRFQRWLVGATLAELAVGASAQLRVMSGGQFSLDLGDGGEFYVVDHGSADERRPVRTLSGGETFQASLALALALADRLGDLSGNARRAMESIFLDEGFGTLDTEALDQVATTIEGLATSGRMVGVVTHVRELAERMPVRYRVSRDPRGATVVREVG